MKAAIFAAGEGKGLQPLTFERPKPLIPILGKTLIQYIWESLPDEVDEVILVVGYKKKMIRSFLGDKFQGKKVTYVEQGQATGTADALMLCKPYLKNEEKFLLMFADELYSKASIACCLKHRAALLIAEIEDPRRFGVVIVNKEGIIQSIEEKPKHPKSKLAVTGVYVLSSEIFDYDTDPTEDRVRYFTRMIDEYMKEHVIYGVETDFWLPIEYPADIKRAEKILGKKKKL
ncbi:MAG: nucleotidyltransferase family protein [Candidatus Pacebacteria bacterium]|nr:nucleotidyltransferase family protein [Candidatus Paceibacterota bacterium]